MESESERESEKEQTEKEEEEEVALVLETTKVIEYLEPIMSVELLCKFPDNSAYDFDYSQSTIWSPLVPIPKKLSSFQNHKSTSTVNKKKLVSRIRKNKQKNTRNKNKLPSDFSPTPPRIKGSCNCNPIIKKGWAKALKAASKKFKRWKAKRDPIAHVMLPKSFQD